MAYDFSSFSKRADDIADWLQKEFSIIRTGAATPSILDGVQVDSYGARVPLNQVGTIGIEDPRTLRVSVWDASQISQVERAISDADLGVSVSSDDSGVRVSFPELTGERRDQLIKVAKSKLEEARVSLRSARDDAMKELDKLEKEGELSGDQRFTAKEDLQKIVDQKNVTFGDLLTKKEAEIAQ